MNLISIAVDLQINPNATLQEIKLLNKIKKQFQKEFSDTQKKRFRNDIKIINEINREVRNYIKIREEKMDSFVNRLESDLFDLKELDEIEKKLEKYHKWKLALKEGVK